MQGMLIQSFDGMEKIRHWWPSQRPRSLNGTISTSRALLILLNLLEFYSGLGLVSSPYAFSDLRFSLDRQFAFASAVLTFMFLGLHQKVLITASQSRSHPFLSARPKQLRP